METNENQDTTIQNLWDTAKAIQVSIQKLERTQIQKLALQIKELEKKTANETFTQQNTVNKDSSRTQ